MKSNPTVMNLNTQDPASPAGISRRRFLGTTAGGVIATQFLTHSVFGADAPSNKLRLAAVGVGSMGASNLKQCTGENVVALCDVDTGSLEKTGAAFPEARRYKDYREMFAKEEDIDGVLIATPDHTHAVITMEAIRRKKHIFCQKPLTHSIFEARTVTEAARKSGVQTQMGNQGHSAEAVRILKEWVQDGAIGEVTEIHAWTDRPVGGDPWSDFPIQARPAETPAVPDTLDWDLWLGPAPLRPYHPAYHPGKWRGWLDFGTGSLGDMGCHIIDPAFFALDLGAPVSVEGSSTHYQEAVMRETFPRASIVRCQFPARGNMPPVTLHWYDGRLRPLRPKGVDKDLPLPGSGAFLVGSEGVILHGSHGASGIRMFPEARFQEYRKRLPAKSLERVKGSHEGDWLRACKDGKPASSTFDYGGPLTELVLLGMAALRLPNQQLEWDAANLKFTNNESANSLVNPAYRDGWKL